MNVLTLQNKIIENPDYIIKILEELKFENIADKGKYIMFSNHGSDTRGCSILKENLVYQNFSHGESGNIFTLVMSEKNFNFPEGLKWVANKLGLSDELVNSKIKYPFGGFYKKIIREATNPELNVQTYDESILNEYPIACTKRFFDDGIDYQTQEKFNLRYDHYNHTILIPTYSFDGKLVGIKARSNDDNSDMRYWAAVPYSKTCTLYGYHQNYKSITEKKICIIVEAEKSVLQASSFGCFVVLAVSGHSISDVQARYIKSLMPDKIIVAFDEGLSEEELIFESKKLELSTKLANTKVGYIYDENNELLEKDSKLSPTDLGKDVFNKLIKNYTKWL